MHHHDASRFADFGPYRLDLRTSRLLSGGMPVPLAPKAVETLKVLVERRGEVVEKDELMRLVWPDSVVEEANLAQQVFTLRRVFGDDPERPRFIATVPRRGYRFVAEVRTVDGASVSNAIEPSGVIDAVTPPHPHGDHRGWQRAAAAGGWAVAAVALVTFAALSRHPESSGAAPVAFDVGWPPGTDAGGAPPYASVAPDGRTVAVVAEGADGVSHIWLRPLDRPSFTRVLGSEGARLPIWSPDGESLAFFADGKLEVLPRGGGVPREVCEAPDPRGASWAADGTIVFAPESRSALFKVAASGGRPLPLTTLDPARRDVSHRWPQMIPASSRFLFEVWSGQTGGQGLFEGSLGGGPVRRILADVSPAAVAGRFLLISRREALVALPFDVDAGEVTGEPILVAAPVPRYPSDESPFGAGGDTVVYALDRFETRLVVTDRTGRTLQASEPAQHGDPAISPDGQRVAYQARDRAMGNENMDLWVWDLSSNTRTRLTFDPSVDVLPVWSPDGRQVAFRSNRSGSSDLYVKQVDAAAAERRILSSSERKDPTDWSPDGRSLLFNSFTSLTDADVWQVAVDGSSPAEALVSGPGVQWKARYAPDGRYLAYASDESGRFEVVVQSLGPDHRRWQVSRTGGDEPSWRRDGRELLFMGEQRALMRVRVTWPGGLPTFSVPERVSAVPGGAGGLRNDVAVAPDGERVVVVRRDAPQARPPLMVVAHWRPGSSR